MHCFVCLFHNLSVTWMSKKHFPSVVPTTGLSVSVVSYLGQHHNDNAIAPTGSAKTRAIEFQWWEGSHAPGKWERNPVGNFLDNTALLGLAPRVKVYMWKDGPCLTIIISRQRAGWRNTILNWGNIWHYLRWKTLFFDLDLLILQPQSAAHQLGRCVLSNSSERLFGDISTYRMSTALPSPPWSLPGLAWQGHPELTLSPSHF